MRGDTGYTLRNTIDGRYFKGKYFSQKGEKVGPKRPRELPRKKT